MGERTDENSDEAFGTKCREEIRVILGLEDNQVFAAFWSKLRTECLQVRRGIEASPNGFRLAPFDKSLTQRKTWLQRQVVNPIETLQVALSDENAPHFAHWERYGDDDPHSDTALLDALAYLKNKATSLQREFEDEITGETAGKITHKRNQAIRSICLLVRAERMLPRTQAFSRELGQGIGPVAV